ncbi:MAG: TRAP transporter large permease [Alphaproteobacteria bacterium]|nr:TRAP transporter large permease [Alphaproteobacteria bacterium]
MEWWAILLYGMAILLALFMSGVPIYLTFLVINVGGVLLLLGQAGFGMFANSLFETTNTEALSAIALFILMGEILFRCGAIDASFGAMDKLVGRVRGRQFFLCISLSTFIGALAGSAMGVAAMLGRSLYPAMATRGYDVRLSIGTILSGASLAPIIPPSVLVIIIGSLADTSIADLLIAGILPGFLLSALFLGYVIIRIRMNPGLYPEMSKEPSRDSTSRDKIQAFWDLMPINLILIVVMGFIMFGICTPSESAALGVIGAVISAVYYRTLSWKMIWDSLLESAAISSMVMVIMACATMFSQLLAFTGATVALTQWVANLGLDPLAMLFVMLAMPFIWCMFCDQIALLIVITPIYQPLLKALQFDPVWFWTLMLINVTVGGMTPPFGYTMFAFKGAAPDVSMRDIFAASWPFVWLYVLSMVIIALFPGVATWLPKVL